MTTIFCDKEAGTWRHLAPFNFLALAGISGLGLVPSADCKQPGLRAGSLTVTRGSSRGFNVVPPTERHRVPGKQQRLKRASGLIPEAPFCLPGLSLTHIFSLKA